MPTWTPQPAPTVDLPSNKYKLKGAEPPELELYQQGKLPSDFSTELEMARSLRDTDVRVWDYGLAFLIGNQDLVTDGLNLSPDRMKEVRGKVVAVTNRILPAYRATVAAFRPQMPAITARSLTASYENEAQAVTTNLAARAAWLQTNMEWVARKGIEWASPCGNFGLHVWPNMDKEKLEVDLVSPYDLLFEPYATRPELARWRAVRKFVMREEAFNLFPDAEELFRTVNSDTGDGESDETYDQQPNGRVELWWVYFKDGRCGVWHKDQWVYEGDYPEGCDPVSIVRWTPVPNRIYGISQVMPAIIPQLRLNQLDELLFTIIKLTSSPQWLVPRQAMIDTRELTNEPGQKIFYNDSARPPELRAPPPAPPSLWDALAMQSAKIEDMMGTHSALTGKRVPNVSSGVGMGTLIGQDEANLAMTMDEFQDGFAAAIKACLVLWKAYLPERSLVRVPGRSASSTITRAISTIDLTDKPDVVFESGSMFAANAKTRDEQLLALVQYGLPIADVVKHLSFKVDEHAEFKRVQADYYSRSLLEAMLQGDTIEWVPEPSFMESIERVFGDFITSPAYFEAKREFTMAMQQEQAQKQEEMVPGEEQGMGEEMDPEGEVSNATDSLQALNNIFMLYQDVYATRMQMQMQMAPPGGASMGSPPAPGGGNKAPPPGKPGANDARRGQQSGPATGQNGSTKSMDAVAFKSGGRTGAP
jgi:hypothetical protein